MPQLLVVFTPAHHVAVLGGVGQMREVTESADDAHRLAVGERLQQLAERLARVGVALQAEGHRKLADALDQLECFGALLLAYDLAQDAAEQPDVLDERDALVRRIQVLGTARSGGGAGHT